jgi:ribosomal protein S18 acetylase RimI-like enzyme
VIDVRIALPPDLPAAAEVWRAANIARGLPPTPSRLARIHEKLTAPDATVLVATLPTAPAEPASAQLAPAERAPAEPASARLAPAEPAPADPALADPALADPALADPALADPALADPALAEPAPAEPAPAEPAPGGSASARPAPAESTPAEPASAGLKVEPVVGMALVEPGRADDGAGEPIPGHGHVSMVFVHPSHWSNGYGKHLLRAVHALGFTRTTLWTRRSNTRAQRLYAAAGYTPTGRSAQLHDDDEIIQLEHLAGTRSS